MAKMRMINDWTAMGHVHAREIRQALIKLIDPTKSKK
jgi:hypothetical protein